MAKTAKPTQEQEENKSAEKTAARAVSRYIRISPRKMRLVVDTVRRKHVERARFILSAINKKAARLTEKVLSSAVANAKDIGLDESRLYIADIRADGGPAFKRFMPRSMGRADRILKRTTHLSLILKEGEYQYKGGSQATAADEATETGTAKKKAAPKKKRAVKKRKKAAAK